MQRIVLVVVVAGSLLVGFAGDASAKTVPANTWAPKFCSALKSYKDTIDTEGSKAEAALSGQVTNLKAAKSQLQSFFKKLVSATKHAVQVLEKAGSPKTPNGSKVAAKFVNALKSMELLFVGSESEAASLRTSSLSKFESGSKKVASWLTKGGDAISKSFQDLSTLDTGDALSNVIQATPECAYLGVGGTTSTTG